MRIFVNFNLSFLAYMESIIHSIELACQQIHQTLSSAFHNIPSDTVSKNASGDIQKPMDRLSDMMITNSLRILPQVAGILSEEQDHFLRCHQEGQYIIAFDPLDGSSNVPYNLTTGSIFGIYHATCLSEISGKTLVAAVYSIYGPALEIVKVTPSQQTRTQYLQRNGIYVSHVLNPHLEIPVDSTGNLEKPFYCVNEGHSELWKPKISQQIQAYKGRSIRWMACFVADVHRLLQTGGTFMYPSSSKAPQGKLRLLYEVYPMAFIWERCGGKSRDETGRSCLEIPFQHDNIHQRSPVILD
jgi:fructose-1,6-bisphosphatase I